jgi:dCMP deaminase
MPTKAGNRNGSRNQKTDAALAKSVAATAPDRPEPAAARSARQNRHTYFMAIAMAVRLRANCKGNRVGAIIVRDQRIVSTGYNGTPANMINCLDDGCYRCANRDKAYQSGEAYDLCICVHAEQNAILAAARFGIAVEGSTLYTTMRPCFGCAKELLQANVQSIYYLHEWTPSAHEDPVKAEKQRAQYDKLMTRFAGGVHRLEMPDPDHEWAVSKRGPSVVSSDRHGTQDM